MAPEAPTIGGETAEQVESQEANVAHRVLDVIPEDPEEPHVSDQMQPAAVKEHGGEGGVPAWRDAEYTARVGREGKGRAGWKPTQQLSGDQAQLANGAHEGLLSPEPLDQQPAGGVRDDQADGDERREKVGVVVADREHGASAV
jgi:hypothetical protein